MSEPPSPRAGAPKATGAEPNPVSTDLDSNEQPLRGVRAAIAYDGLFPWSIGGAERWYRALAEGLARAGANVTYVTRLQWDNPPQIEGVEVVAVRGPRDIYHADGTRRVDQPIRYAVGLMSWMLRNRGSFDILHLANFPYFPLLATRAALARTGQPVLVDWFEVWPERYWTEYGGKMVGRFGYLIQELCIRLTPTALVFWDHTAQRLREHGLKSRPVVLPGLLPDADPSAGVARDRLTSPATVFFSGRHIKDKGVMLLPEALRIARAQIPDLHLVIAGEGVQTPLVRAKVEALGLSHCVKFVGKLTDTDLFSHIAGAACVAVPSIREGYGLAAVEANAHGTPAIVTDGPENAAVGHIINGRNGYLVPPTPAGVAGGIVRAVKAGPTLRQTTFEEYARMTTENGIGRSIDRVVGLYLDALAGTRRGADAAGPAGANGSLDERALT